MKNIRKTSKVRVLGVRVKEIDLIPLLGERLDPNLNPCTKFPRKPFGSS